ncbi:tripartite tricarboxylate transporter TctB family protein [Diaphorobacter aerolatus]|uniref:Tripartite tricarboxylate transporter TctB family protein n=1 Tax=Diaphorobacter aerolatus TaxID=1288495 RepID=A0A7H0GJP0_9BURK|nr:tripartite tricarboxylate transporter TctB family protein [Diaphorobacter aerolatus]QNP48506.1 tripartite tricarboxylate transporter TctB family protein [Diaphorobacter aerolatus]
MADAVPPPSAANPLDELSIPSPKWQAAVGVGVLVVAGIMAVGALQIPGDAGYGGVGPNFLPWLCAIVLALCGALLIWEAMSGGYRHAADPGGSKHAKLVPFAWVTAGLLLNAVLITHIGFILSCTMCYTLAVQGLRRGEGQTHLLAPANLAKDVITGLLISAPVFWLFTQFLAIALPGLTDTGWL